MPHDIIVGIRHFKDKDMLRTHLFNAPLEAGQEQLVRVTAIRVLELAESLLCSRVRIMHSSRLRSASTAQMIAKQLSNLLPVSLTMNSGLDEMSLGIPKLPIDYRDGEHFPIINKAWENFNRETFVRGDFSFRFGTGDSSHFFELPGECLLDLLVRQYPLLIELFTGGDPAELLVLSSHSITLWTLCELVELSSCEVGKITANELPRQCWFTFQNNKNGNIPKTIEDGQLLVFDVRKVREAGIPQLLRLALGLFKQRLASVATD